MVGDPATAMGCFSSSPTRTSWTRSPTTTLSMSRLPRSLHAGLEALGQLWVGNSYAPHNQVIWSRVERSERQDRRRTRQWSRSQGTVLLDPAAALVGGCRYLSTGAAALAALSGTFRTGPRA